MVDSLLFQETLSIDAQKNEVVRVGNLSFFSVFSQQLNIYESFPWRRFWFMLIILAELQ